VDDVPDVLGELFWRKVAMELFEESYQARRCLLRVCLYHLRNGLL